jgi:hypothetical protein
MDFCQRLYPCNTTNITFNTCDYIFTWLNTIHIITICLIRYTYYPLDKRGFNVSLRYWLLHIFHGTLCVSFKYTVSFDWYKDWHVTSEFEISPINEGHNYPATHTPANWFRLTWKLSYSTITTVENVEY